MTGRSRARSASRLAAVQALYQLDMENPSLPQLLNEFHMHRLGAEIEDVEYAAADVTFFDDVVKGTDARLEEIDELIAGKLAQGWSLARCAELGNRMGAAKIATRGGQNYTAPVP